ncbi:hypothetical protein [Fuerstiella marisgermanici]|uniref:Ternary complex associated domain-containing protein n=1 Tax=Fuerstiella marisgermanici TaxID=1891926 RepID=A0A1P8WK04_9PLAN|nr:hypothetical protein [Fuerstiella marisgermanici]APZ94397.1 hypothetical protein Fuma_04029 [Fuerstiella marisgermanici]
MKDIEFDVLSSDAEKSVRQSASALLDQLTGNGTSDDNLRKLIWPTIEGVDKNDVVLRLVPLNRLGADEGKSSASVFVAYFRPSGERWPSHPLIVKFAKPTRERDSCHKEYDDYQSVSNYIALSPCGFATPLVCHKHGDSQPFTVLWSPFASAGGIWGVEAYQQTLNLRIDDVWKGLTNNSKAVDEISNALDKAFDYLWPLHHRGGTAGPSLKSVFGEYNRYLRKIDTADWSNHWRSCWGDATVKTTQMFGIDWPNPFRVLKRISAIEIRMYCGGVHGDLHPKNIVFAQDGPRIIDFGWADGDAHIAKDFVLMECNLRYVTLASAMPYSEILKLSDWLGFDDHEPEFETEGLRHRVQLISQVRSRAKKAFPTDTNWDNEYIIPMFIVAMGLLKHSDDFYSHISTQLHVLQLARYISEKVLPHHE